MAKSKTNTRVLTQHKLHRRQWLTFLRMCRYGVNNFTRNAWLTIAATAVMTITLLVVFVTVVAQNVLHDTTTQVAENIDRSIYLKSGTTEEQAKRIISGLKSLSNVRQVTFIDSEEGRQQFANDKKQDNGLLGAINEATNKIPATIRINLYDPSDVSQLLTFVDESNDFKKLKDPNREPTFASKRQQAADTIASWTTAARQVGIGASILFTAISMLIIFNTIRMAIFNRKDEIEMMKLIGADKGFIRGPFVVEAIVYGFFAAIIASAAGFALLYTIRTQIADWGVNIEPTIGLFTSYAAFVILGMIGLGALVGMISSLLATRRHLKI